MMHNDAKPATIIQNHAQPATMIQNDAQPATFKQQQAHIMYPQPPNAHKFQLLHTTLFLGISSNTLGALSNESLMYNNTS